MSEFKGTKGEWFACCAETKPHYLFSNDGEVTICGFIKKQDDGTVLSDEEVRSNAKLISCAPEMLEALKDMVSFAEFHGYTSSTEINNARVIIKKATE